MNMYIYIYVIYIYVTDISIFYNIYIYNSTLNIKYFTGKTLGGTNAAWLLQSRKGPTLEVPRQIWLIPSQQLVSNSNSIGNTSHSHVDWGTHRISDVLISGFVQKCGTYMDIPTFFFAISNRET